MIDEIVAIYAIVEDLLKAIGHQKDCRIEMSDAEVITAALVATRMSIINVARTGKFSSDRSIQEYCEDIWQAEAVPIAIEEYSQANAGLQVNN
ncbi:MAG: glycogen/starch/alpha-glucan phosphorylase [Xenococcus sp. MO_188.B8]|nr:glycogen/starch/alpha-glucan phosphorylase [Xenococcus sp. MO_188.B8]